MRVHTGEPVSYRVGIKDYKGATGDEARKYSPPTCTVIDKVVVSGNPDDTKISNSYVERQNLTMRMGMRRFTRLTNGFSKKIENLTHAVSLHFMHDNFCRPHQTLTKKAGKRTTPRWPLGSRATPGRSLSSRNCWTSPLACLPCRYGSSRHPRS